MLEDPGRTFVLGVRWRPEDTDGFRVFEAFVEAADARRMALRRGRRTRRDARPQDGVAVGPPHPALGWMP